MNNGLEFLVHTKNVTTPIMSVLAKCQLHLKNFFECKLIYQQTLVMSCILLPFGNFRSQLPLYQGEFTLISFCAESEKI
jgi:hypothetical protein